MTDKQPIFSFCITLALWRAIEHLKALWPIVRTLSCLLKGGHQPRFRALELEPLTLSFHFLYGENVNGAQELGVLHRLSGDCVGFVLEPNAHETEGIGGR